MAALAVGVPWTFVVLPLIDTGNAALFALAMAGTYAVAASSYGPMAAFIPEIFGTRYRYSGAGLSLNLAGSGRRRSADDRRRAATGDVGRAGGRRHDGCRRCGQPRVHRRPARDERRSVATPLSTMRETCRLSNARVVRTTATR